MPRVGEVVPRSSSMGNAPPKWELRMRTWGKRVTNPRVMSWAATTVSSTGAPTIQEVENLIYRLPGVARVAAVAKADPDLGERVCAVVVVEPGTHLSLESVVPPSPPCRWPATSSPKTCWSWRSCR